MSLKAAKNVLVISVHPDDEALGCAGTVLKHADEGANVFWAIITNVKAEYQYGAETVTRRNAEISDVAKKLSCKELLNLELKPASLEPKDIPTISQKLGAFVKDKNIDTIYCVNRSDAHSDHRITFEAAVTLIKSFRYPSVKRFLSYECLSETEFGPPLAEKVFLPILHVNITEQWERKIEIVNIYKSELGIHPFPRSIKNIEALATIRGAFSGHQYSEAFHVMKDTWD
mgnify:CR=1 FL=1